MARATLTNICEAVKMAHGEARQRLGDAGVKPDSKGRYDNLEAIRVLKLSKDATLELRDRVADLPNGAGRSTTGDDEARRALVASKRDSEHERARRLKLQNDKLEGRLVDREAVLETGKDIVAKARQAFLSIGAKLAPKLAAETDVNAIRAMIDDEARSALRELASEENFINEVLGI